jgi:hypothetical protein
MRGRLLGSVSVRHRRATQTRSADTLRAFLLARLFPVGFPRSNSNIRCRALPLSGRVRLGTGGVLSGTDKQADGRCVSASSHAIGLLHCVLVTKVIAVFTTADTVWCTVFGSLGVATSILLLLLLPACRWFLDCLPARHSLTPTPLHC